jgi:hypothetical protein
MIVNVFYIFIKDDHHLSYIKKIIKKIVEGATHFYNH